MSTARHIAVVGGGVFGLTAALELNRRGFRVTVVEPGPIPHPLAASTDISKVVRMEYGADEQYMAMVEEAIPGFERWNEELGHTHYHNTGISLFSLRPLEPGSFEYESLQTLRRRGHHPERLGRSDIQIRFPAWSAAYVDGVYHARGGYVESGPLMRALAGLGEREGVDFRNDSAMAVHGHRVVCTSGRTLEAEAVVVAAGAWTPILVPDLAPFMRSTGHPVFHLRPQNPALFSPPAFTTFMADVARTGWYGFPYNPAEGVVKLANHGVGREVHPVSGERLVYAADHTALRTFLAMAFPALADAEVVYTRRCLYCDTLDGDLWIDHHPLQPGLVVATGGSGHAMKFAPVLGSLIADAVEGRPHRWLPRFRWRQPDGTGPRADASRHRE